jgi:hypothetical protein
MKGERKLKVCVNKVLRGVFGLKMDGVTESVGNYLIRISKIATNHLTLSRAICQGSYKGQEIYNEHRKKKLKQKFWKQETHTEVL